jgi:3-oxoacyl-[acyl-carrier-protein] synthase-1
MIPVAIVGSGLVTAVGLSAPAACAAIRVGISGLIETRFMFAGEWLLGCHVALNERWRGRDKLIRMAVAAIKECLETAPRARPAEIPILLCVAEDNRPGRLSGLDATLLRDVQAALGVTFHDESGVIASGRMGGVRALDQARTLIDKGRPYAIVAGVDSLLVGPTLTEYNNRRRLHTADNSDGFFPGEGAAAVLVTHASHARPELQCLGTGYGTEPAPLDSDKPLRAEGMVEAFKAALAESSATFAHLDYHIADISGEQYGFKEAALALTRVLRIRKEQFYMLHPADCIGEVGAAIVPVMMAVALAAGQKHYARGPGALCHVASDASERAAIVLRYNDGGAE